MKFKVLLKNESGMSLISVMIASAIGLIVAIGMASMFTNMQLAQNFIKFKSESDNTIEEIRALMSDVKACTNTFKDLKAEPSVRHVITSLRDGTTAPGVIKYEVGKVYNDNTLLVEAITLDNFLPGAWANKGIMTLLVLYKTNKNASGPPTLPRSIQISLERNAALEITSCIALSKMSDGIWQRTAANLNNIFFAGGNVGVGTTTPDYSLQVGGGTGLSITGASNVATLILGPAPSGTNRDYTSMISSISDVANNYGSQLAFHTHENTSNFGNPTERMRISTNGNIGIGTTAPVSGLDLNKTTLTVRGGAANPIELISGNTLPVLKWYGSSSLVIGNDASPANIGNNASGNQLVAITPAGNVGIGTTAPRSKLEVNGDIKIGFATTCNSNTAGAMRYSGGAIEYCNGTSYQRLGGIGPSYCYWQNAGNCEYNACECAPGEYAAGIQVGIRAAGNWGANTWSMVKCCRP